MRYEEPIVYSKRNSEHIWPRASLISRPGAHPSTVARINPPKCFQNVSLKTKRLFSTRNLTRNKTSSGCFGDRARRSREAAGPSLSCAVGSGNTCNKGQRVQPRGSHRAGGRDRASEAGACQARRSRRAPCGRAPLEHLWNTSGTP
jgi:hypothetical protein